MNDSNEKYRNLLFLVRSHSFSLILLAAGIAWTSMYIRSVMASTETADLSQPTQMLYAGLALIVSAVLAMPAVLDRIPQKAYRVLLAAGVLGAVYFFSASTNSVLDEEQFLKDQKAMNALTIQRLTDIRDAQLAYKEVNGAFTDSFDTLFAFISAPLVPLNFSIGSFHDTLPEAMSFEEGYVIQRADVPGIAAELGWDEKALMDSITADAVAFKVRDTLYTSFYAENFAPEKRADKKLPMVNLDSLSFSPSSGERFFIDTTYVDQSGLRVSAIKVQDPTPFGRANVKKDTLRFGSLVEAHTDGNWRQ
ncbi:MAG: hypothetical protein L7S63_05110 [Flavobacteriales bacterium]|nr:hypothetical protein [Flavobacteriales bacterium]